MNHPTKICPCCQKDLDVRVFLSKTGKIYGYCIECRSGYQRHYKLHNNGPKPVSCEICGVVFEKSIPPCLDHDHETGVTRGWLCRQCNIGIGQFGDSVERLQAAIAYLKKYQVILTNV